jgi:hypothetical protein
LHSQVALEAVGYFYSWIRGGQLLHQYRFYSYGKNILPLQDQIWPTGSCFLKKKIELTGFILMEGNLANEREM